MFFTGMARPADRTKAMSAGATEYLIKPNDLDRFAETIERLLHKSSTVSKISDGVNDGIY
jgi:DNA-binding NtrC family response regulator